MYTLGFPKDGQLGQKTASLITSFEWFQYDDECFVCAHKNQKCASWEWCDRSDEEYAMTKK